MRHILNALGQGTCLITESVFVPSLTGHASPIVYPDRLAGVRKKHKWRKHESSNWPLI